MVKNEIFNSYELKNKNILAIQEFLNALTIILPFLYSIAIWKTYKSNQINFYEICIISGTMIHLPFSFMYHIMRGFSTNYYKIILWKRLDLIFIHIASTIFSFAISRCIYYGLINMIYNFIEIYNIWFITNGWKNCIKRNIKISISIFLYLSPMIVRNHFDEFIYASLFILFGMLCFKISGYYHIVFHILLIGLQHYLLQSASK